MALIENTLFEGVVNKVDVAIERLRAFTPSHPNGYYLGFSGGKDSIVIKKIAELARERHGIKFESWYHNTTIDPPDLVRYIRKYHPDVNFANPEKSFFQRLEERRFPPTRMIRWCCEEFKEQSKRSNDRFVVTGVRWAESSRRSKRRMVESCMKSKRKTYLHLIIDWTDAEVWSFIKQYELPYCILYDEGWKRIGCLLCPMADYNRQRELERYPKYERAFRIWFRKMFDARIARGMDVRNWKNGDDAFDWWMKASSIRKKAPNQTVMIFE